MTVWVVVGTIPYSHSFVEGVFSTREAAQAELDRQRALPRSLGVEFDGDPEEHEVK